MTEQSKVLNLIFMKAIAAETLSAVKFARNELIKIFSKNIWTSSILSQKWSIKSVPIVDLKWKNIYSINIKSTNVRKNPSNVRFVGFLTSPPKLWTITWFASIGLKNAIFVIITFWWVVLSSIKLFASNNKLSKRYIFYEE